MKLLILLYSVDYVDFKSIFYSEINSSSIYLYRESIEHLFSSKLVCNKDKNRGE